MKEIKLLKYNKPFPYRQLREILSLEEIIEIFNDSINFTHISFKKLNERLAKFFYMRYGKRYPFEQEKEYLVSYILQLKDTYIDTFYNNMVRMFGNEELSINDYKKEMLKGNVLKYGTKSGSSSSPYNIVFDKIGDVIQKDNLWEKNLSETKQTHKYEDLVKRSKDIMYSKLNGEVINFIDSFYSLFSQIDISLYIEKELGKIMSLYKNIINDIVSDYNQLKSKLNILLKGKYNVR